MHLRNSHRGRIIHETPHSPPKRIRQGNLEKAAAVEGQALERTYDSESARRYRGPDCAAGGDQGKA